MADSSANTSNGSSNLVVILLVLNLLVAVAVLAHVVYYIPDDSAADSSEPQLVTELQVDGVGNIGMSPKGIELEMIELNQNNPTGAPRVMQTVTMSQEAFLNTLGRMSLLRERLVEKELVREVE
jgi:hypothetical protein